MEREVSFVSSPSTEPHSVFEDLWVKENAYYERPTVSFRHEMIGRVIGNTTDSVLAFGTSQSYLDAFGDSVCAPTLYATPTENDDGEIVEILVEAVFEIGGSDTIVQGIQGLLTLDYALDVRC